MSDKTIKSVRRIFEILELFDKERRPLAAKEISKKLGYPLISSHALLKSMHELGYADFDPPNWTYIPSRSFLSVLDWVPDILERERRLLDFVEEVNNETSETVNISRRVNAQVRIIYGLESQHTVGVVVKVGAMMPITHSLTGITALAGDDKDQSQLLLERLKEYDPVQYDELDHALLNDIFSEIADRGTVSRCDLFIPGVGAVCVPIKTSDEKDCLVVGVVGPSDRIREAEKEHRKTLKRLVKIHKIHTVYKLR